MSAEVKRIFSGEHHFSPLLREKSVPFFQYDHLDIVDIDLMFRISFSDKEVAGNVSPVCSENLRIYLNEFDISEEVRLELIDAASLVPEALFKSQYQLGVQKYSDQFDALSVKEAERAGDAAFFADYVADNSIPEFFATLGDRNIGWAGNLHVLCFLYSFVAIQPISLRNCWKRHVETHGLALPDELEGLPRIVVSFAHHASPSQSEVDPTDSWPAGQVHYQMEVSYKNPLEPKLREIARRIKQFNILLEAQRLNYLDPLKDESDELLLEIQQAHASLKADLEKVQRAIAEIG